MVMRPWHTAVCPYPHNAQLVSGSVQYAILPTSGGDDMKEILLAIHIETLPEGGYLAARPRESEDIGGKQLRK